MPTSSDVQSPVIIYELLFRAASESDDFNAPNSLKQVLAEILGLHPKMGSNLLPDYEGNSDGIGIEISCAAAHDTHLLRLKLCLAGMHAVESWQKLEEKGRSILAALASDPKNPRPWGATCLYQAMLNDNGAGISLANFPLDSGTVLHTDPASTPYGWLWLLKEQEYALAPGMETWTRSLALLVPEERYEKVNDYFLAPLTQGLARIELYLHKGKHHARLQLLTHDRLDAARRTLQESMNHAISGAEFGSSRGEHQELDRISKYLMRFLTQVASQEILLNSLKANRTALKEHLDLMKMDIPLYQKEMLLLERHIEQLTADILNARSVLDSTYAFQEIHRSVETIRLERASMLMGAAAALLAGVAVFNSFLDIWNLALEGSGLVRPASWLRILLGFLTGVSLPLAAAWFVEKRHGRAVISILVGVLSVSAAILATILVNQ